MRGERDRRPDRSDSSQVRNSRYTRTLTVEPLTYDHTEILHPVLEIVP